MDLASLQAFVAVADSASFSQAGNRLHLTQPAISKRIAALEADVRNRLFDRIGRRVSLTEAGQALLPRARHILAEVEDSRRALSQLSGQVGGRLSMATSHHIGLHHLPPVLRSFTARYPGVQLDLQFLDSEAACAAVERGDLELALVTLPLQMPRNLVGRRIWADPLCVVVGRDHPLAAHRHIDRETLVGHPAILPAPGTYTRALIERALGQTASRLRPGLSTHYLETIKMMVSVGLGWSILPRTLLDAGLRELPVQGLKPVRDLGVVCHPQRTLSNAARALIGLLEDESQAA